MLFSILVICVVFGILVVDLVLRQRRQSPYVENLPKLPFKMFVPLLRPNITTAEIYHRMEQLTNYCHGLVAFWIFPKLVIICDDPVNLKTILMSGDCLNKPYHYRMVPASGDGILFSRGISNRDEYFRFKGFYSFSDSPSLAKRPQKCSRGARYEHSEDI